MGDRRMAEIRTHEGSLYVYTHSYGSEFVDMAHAAVDAAASRMYDTSYALRIVVDQLTKPGRDEQIGFGLMFSPMAEDEYNGDRPSILIDLTKHGLISVYGRGLDSDC